MRTILAAMLFLLVAAFAADTDLAGGYAGEWKSSTSGNGGGLRFMLENSDGVWKGTAAFSLDAVDVSCTMRTAKLQDGKLELVYDFDAQGTALRSTQKGEWNGSEFKGTYKTTTTDGQAIDEGTWSAKRKK